MQASVVEPIAHYVTLDGSANALAVSRDSSQVVVAGRNIFKIYNVEPTKFVERLNLRIGKNVDLSYSCADVVWSPVEDALLATAATNGSVVTWNLNASHKQELKFHDHKRTVNKVCFHTSEAHYLLSGSQDGTMKLFDLRKKEVAQTFYSLSESVRDVQFCPHQYFSFAAVQENGYIQLWDIRRTDRFERQFAAHSGPVFSCDWHPEDRNLIATAGRDKTIKVWDIAVKDSLDSCIQTIASVSKVKWRPSRRFNVASSALVVDFTLSVWDYRRPYVPFASFIEHKDVITGFSWCSPQSLLSTSKDCSLVHHVFTSASRPADRANPVGLHINRYGDVSYAYKKIHKDVAAAVAARETLSPNAKVTNFPSSKLPFFKKSTGSHEKTKVELSALSILENAHELLSMKWFVETAKRYILHGKPLPDLCEHNASVAADLNRPHIAQAWYILKLLFTSGSMLMNEYSQMGSQDKSSEEKALESSSENSFKHALRLNNNFRNQHNSSKSSSRHVSGGSRVARDRGVGDHSGQMEDSDSGNTEHENTITYFASEFAQSDFFFGDGEAELFRMLDYSQLSSLPADEDWTLPREAFTVRHRLGDGSPPPEVSNMPSSPLCAAEEISDNEYVNEEEEQNIMLALYNAPRFPPWNATPIVVDQLNYFAEQGDVQMSVSILLVLGDKIRNSVDEAVQENWFHSYLDLLSRFQLWNISNEVIALSSLPAINSLNQQSTSIHSLCGKCNKLMSGVGWFCQGCKHISVCSICHQIVRGVFVWCQGCAHGGHLMHLKGWFKENRLCPTGCGHICEFS